MTSKAPKCLLKVERQDFRDCGKGKDGDNSALSEATETCDHSF